jgi:ubiquinone/menaquinone biosynthesis C-methylase UbiE
VRRHLSFRDNCFLAEKKDVIAHRIATSNPASAMKENLPSASRDAAPLPQPLSSENEIKSAYTSPKVAEEYIAQRFINELHRLLHDRQVAAVQQVMDQMQPKRILEIAPGPGRLTRDLRPTGPLICLEYNEGMIEQGRGACGGKAAWIRGNGFSLPFAPSFDLVYSFRFIRHFHRADRDRLYAQVRRVLLPGGHFVFDAVNERVSRPLREANPSEYPIYDKLYRPENLHRELADAGLEVVTLDPVQKFLRMQSISQWLLGPRARWLNRLVIRGLERLSWRDGLEWIVTCRRA